MDFSVGDKVEKITGDYKFIGVVVSVFEKLNGKKRIVVENEDGVLHIFSYENLTPKKEEYKNDNT